jgi:hypothetical protein
MHELSYGSNSRKTRFSKLDIILFAILAPMGILLSTKHLQAITSIVVIYFLIKNWKNEPKQVIEPKTGSININNVKIKRQVIDIPQTPKLPIIDTQAMPVFYVKKLDIKK